MSADRSKPRPYSEIRRGIINIGGNPSASSPPPPARPAGLDTRLPSEELQRLRNLKPAARSDHRAMRKVFDPILVSVSDELVAIDPETHWFELLTPGRRAVVLLYGLQAEVNNGGFDQFYLNSAGDGAALTPEALRLMRLDEIAAIVEKANAQFPGGPSRSRAQRLAQMDCLPASAAKVWDKLTDAFFDQPFDDMGAVIQYARAHESEFYQTR